MKGFTLRKTDIEKLDLIIQINEDTLSGQPRYSLTAGCRILRFSQDFLPLYVWILYNLLLLSAGRTLYIIGYQSSLIAQSVKNLAAVQETQVQSLGQEDPLGKDNRNTIKERIHLQCRRPRFNPWVRKIPWRRKWQPTPVSLPGKISWTEEPGGLKSMGLQRVRHD